LGGHPRGAEERRVVCGKLLKRGLEEPSGFDTVEELSRRELRGGVHRLVDVSDDLREDVDPGAISSGSEMRTELLQDGAVCAFANTVRLRAERVDVVKEDALLLAKGGKLSLEVAAVVDLDGVGTRHSVD
jgi:hypothetical protein